MSRASSFITGQHFGHVKTANLPAKMFCQLLNETISVGKNIGFDLCVDTDDFVSPSLVDGKFNEQGSRSGGPYQTVEQRRVYVCSICLVVSVRLFIFVPVFFNFCVWLSMEGKSTCSVREYHAMFVCIAMFVIVDVTTPSIHAMPFA